MLQPQLFEEPVPLAGEVWLSRLVLNPRHRGVRREVGDCYALHRTVMSAFPDLAAETPARERLGVLYRLEADERRNRLVLLVQSHAAPDWSRLALADNGPPYCLEAPESKAIGATLRTLRAGQRLLFRLRANPTECKSHGKQSGRRGKPVAVFGEERQLAWLARQGTAGGFRILAARVRPGGGGLTARSPHTSVAWQQGRKSRDEPQVSFGAVIFEGELSITEADAFRRTLAKGIGRGKAYGFGLLSIAPGR